MLLPLTIYQLFHNWGEWLFLTALGLGWFAVGYRFVRDVKDLRRIHDRKPDPGSA